MKLVAILIAALFAIPHTLSYPIAADLLLPVLPYYEPPEPKPTRSPDKQADLRWFAACFRAAHRCYANTSPHLPRYSEHRCDQYMKSWRIQCQLSRQEERKSGRLTDLDYARVTGAVMAQQRYNGGHQCGVKPSDRYLGAALRHARVMCDPA